VPVTDTICALQIVAAAGTICALQIVAAAGTTPWVPKHTQNNLKEQKGNKDSYQIRFGYPS
jgi:hypothetical protein